MAYNKKADANYRKKCNQIALKYTPNESNDYNRLRLYCNDNGLSVQGYIKGLIRRDLDNKGVVYPDMIDNDNNDLNND